MKLAACTRLAIIPENRVWFRAVHPKYSSSPLGTAHTAALPSRFSPGPISQDPYELLYLSQNQIVCLYEVEALLGSSKTNPVADPANPWLIINVEVSLQRVVDLTQVTEQRRLGTTAQELTGD